MALSLPEFDYSNYNPRDPWQFPPQRLARFAFEAMSMMRPYRSRWAVERPYPDVRFAVYHEIYGELHALGVMALMLRQDVLRPEWWQSQPELGRALSKDTIQANHMSIREFLFSGFLHGLMRHLEQAFRQILRSIDPEAPENRGQGMRRVWKQLLRQTALRDREPVLIMLLILRDSTSTGGKFCPSNRKDLRIKYRGRTYAFANDQVVEGSELGFIDTWDFLLFLLRETAELLQTIFESPHVAALPVIKARYL